VDTGVLPFVLPGKKEERQKGRKGRKAGQDSF
jgi:hypothetical protein